MAAVVNRYEGPRLHFYKVLDRLFDYPGLRPIEHLRDICQLLIEFWRQSDTHCLPLAHVWFPLFITPRSGRVTLRRKALD
jgi:hypothetical protein